MNDVICWDKDCIHNSNMRCNRTEIKIYQGKCRSRVIDTSDREMEDIITEVQKEESD